MSFHNKNKERDNKAGNHKPFMPDTDPDRSLDPLEKKSTRLDKRDQKKLKTLLDK